MNSSGPGVLALLIVASTGAAWFRAMARVRVPKNCSHFLALWLAGAALGVVALTGSPGWIGGVSASLSVAGGTFFLLAFAISRQKVAPGAIAVGSMLPAFTALDDEGKIFDSASLAGHPVLIKFFRGHW